MSTRKSKRSSNNRNKESLFQIGCALYSEGYLEEATRTFEALTILDGRNPNLHCILGFLAEKSGRSDIAIVRYTMALNIDTNNFTALIHRGELYLALGQFKNATIDFKKIVESDRERRHSVTRRAESCLVVLDCMQKIYRKNPVEFGSEKATA